MINYTSADFDAQRTPDYTLLARLGLDEQVLAVVDEAWRLKFAMAYGPGEMDGNVWDRFPLGFSQVKLAVVDAGHLFLPAEVFDEAYTQTYFSYLPNDGLVNSGISDISSLGIKLLHQTHRLGMESLIARFPQAHSYPTIQALLCSVADYGKKSEDLTFVLDKQSSRITLCVFKAGRFIYSNDFELYSITDLDYYLLSLLEHLGLADEHPQIYLSGDITMNDAIHQLLLTYGKTVLFADSGLLTGVAIPAELQQHQHRLLTLLGLRLCG